MRAAAACSAAPNGKRCAAGAFERVNRVAKITPPTISNTTTIPIPNATGNALFSSLWKSSGMRESFEGSAPEGNSRNQGFRQSGARHSLLNGGHVVWYSPEFYGVRAQLGNREAGARISIPRLAHGSRIEQVGLSIADIDLGRARARRHFQPHHFHIRFVEDEAALQMRMPKKSDGQRRLEQPFERLRLRENIFVFIAQRSMHERHPVKLQRPG